jgi:general secretion pathway protein K
MRRQRGVALVLVIWAAVLITVIATTFMVERRTDAMVIGNSASLARAEAAAEAGVHRAMYEIYRNDPSADRWRADGTPRTWDFDGVPLYIEIRDESAKIDVNTASEALLRGLLATSGVEEVEAQMLLDAILDWRDPDALRRPVGAEEPEYRQAGLAYKPANAPFQAIEELQLVLGMRPETYRRLQPSITVYSRQPGINPQLASREVLMAVPGITAEIVERYIADREAARAQGQPLPTLPQAGAFASGSTMVLNVLSEARLEDGTVFVREAVALMRPVPRKPVTFVAWRERSVPAERNEAAKSAEAIR